MAGSWAITVTLTYFVLRFRYPLSAARRALAESQVSKFQSSRKFELASWSDILTYETISIIRHAKVERAASSFGISGVFSLDCLILASGS
jgi:hypothetical protein